LKYAKDWLFTEIGIQAYIRFSTDTHQKKRTGHFAVNWSRFQGRLKAPRYVVGHINHAVWGHSLFTPGDVHSETKGAGVKESDNPQVLPVGRGIRKEKIRIE